MRYIFKWCFNVADDYVAKVCIDRYRREYIFVAIFHTRKRSYKYCIINLNRLDIIINEISNF